MHGFATSLLGAHVEFQSGRSGRVVAVGQSLQGFGLVLTLLTEQGQFQEGHSSEVKSCRLERAAPVPRAPGKPTE